MRRTGTRRGRPPIHSLCGGHSRCGGVRHRPGRSWASSAQRPGKTLRLRPDSTTRSVPHCATRPAAAPGAAGRSGSSGEPGEEPCERVSRQTSGWAESPEFPLSYRGIVRRDEELNKIGFAPVPPVRNRPPAQFERSTHLAQPATPSPPEKLKRKYPPMRSCDAGTARMGCPARGRHQPGRTPTALGPTPWSVRCSRTRCCRTRCSLRHSSRQRFATRPPLLPVAHERILSAAGRGGVAGGCRSLLRLNRRGLGGGDRRGGGSGGPARTR